MSNANAMTIRIHAATPDDAPLLAELAHALTAEIVTRTGVAHFDLDQAATARLCRRLMEEERYCALVAKDGSGQPIGFVGLCESHALYAEGSFGIVQECYVVTAFRSHGVGAALLQAAADIGRRRHWRRLELCTPPLPEFVRSLAFYASHGFEVTGGRKMKRAL